MNKRLLVLIAASVFATGAVAADNMQSGSYDKQFNKQDKNHDGKISKDEAGKTLKKDWSQADTNNDGSVDKAEFSAFESAHGKKPAKADEPAKGAD